MIKISIPKQVLVDPMQEETTAVLDVLYVTNETLSADEIATAADMPITDVEQALALLEHHGYVSIGVKADHANFHAISLTRKGVKAVEDDLPYATQYHERFDPVPGYHRHSETA